MKKVLIFASLVLFSMSLSASDELLNATQTNGSQSSSEQLARRSRGGSVQGWYTFIGHCNVRYAPSTDSPVAFT